MGTNSVDTISQVFQGQPECKSYVVGFVVRYVNCFSYLAILTLQSKLRKTFCPVISFFFCLADYNSELHVTNGIKMN